MKITMKIPSAQPAQRAHTKHEGATFSAAIDAAGHGKFQYMVFATAGLIYFTSGMQSGVNAYILPSVKCAFQLSDSQMGILNAAFLAGGCFSAHLWGALSDSYGRRPVLMCTALLDSLCIVASALAPSYAVFAVLRLFSGMLNMAPAGMSFLYMGEFIGDKRRTAFMQALGALWIAAWVVLPGMAWVVIPQPWSLPLPLPLPGGLAHLESWRLFFLMLLLPTLGAALLAFLVPETPKFLQAAGREEAALSVYRRIYALNTGDSGDNYPVKQLYLPSSAKAHAQHGAHGAHGVGVLDILARTLRTSVELFRPPVLYRTVTCCLVYFCNMFVLYGFGYWLPELLNRFELYSNVHPGERATVCVVLTSEAELLNSTATPLLDMADGIAGTATSCGDETVVSPSAFLHTAMVNCASITVNLLSALITGYIGRRSLSALCNVLAGLVGFGILYAASTMEVVIIAIFFTAMAETGCVAINGMLVDNFPSRVSAVGVASVMLSGRLGGSVGNLAMGYLLEHSCQLPLLLLFSTAIVGGLMCCLTQPKFTEEDVEEVPAVGVAEAKGAAGKFTVVGVPDGPSFSPNAA